MKLIPVRLMDHARSDEGRKQLRYAGVVGRLRPARADPDPGPGTPRRSAAPTQLHLLDHRAAILTLPELLRQQVRRVEASTRTDNLRTQILGLLGGRHARRRRSPRARPTSSSSWSHDRCPVWSRASRLFVAQLVGFGIVWVGRYLILDRWIFKVTHHGEEPGEDDLDDAPRRPPDLIGRRSRIRLRPRRRPPAGFMPPDEGLALYEAGLDAAAACAGRAAARGRLLLRQVVDLPRRRGSRRRHGAVRPRPPPGLRGEPAGLGVARARPGRPRGGTHGHAAVVPAHDARRRARAVGGRGRRGLARRSASFWTTPSRCSSSTAATATSRPHRDYELWTPHVAAGRPPGHPRRVPRSGRRRSPAVRDLPAERSSRVASPRSRRPARSGCSTACRLTAGPGQRRAGSSAGVPARARGGRLGSATTRARRCRPRATQIR